MIIPIFLALLMVTSDPTKKHQSFLGQSEDGFNTDTCITIHINGNKDVFSNVQDFINITISISNNSSEIVFLPETFYVDYYSSDSLTDLRKSRDNLVFHIQKRHRGKFLDFIYPPNDIILDYYFDYSDTLIQLEPKHSINYYEDLMLFQSMPPGKYRIRAMYNYPFRSECGEKWSNWFCFTIAKFKTS